MKTKLLVLVILIPSVIGIIFGGGCIKKLASSQETSTLNKKPISLSNIQEEKLSFTKYYSLSPLDITLQTSQYHLPLSINKISNFDDFSKEIPLSAGALTLLKKNGFVVIDNCLNPKQEYITEPYKTLKDREIPIFITSDSLLHLYHIQFNETLRQIEEKEFYDKIWEINKELFDDSIEKYNNATGDLKEVTKRNVAYLAVGLSLLQPKKDQLCKEERECKDPGLASAYFKEEDLIKYSFEVPDLARPEVEMELQLIGQHQGFSKSPIFIYQEDYSQYVPRGHYTRSEKLKNYFKAFMWYGRMSMLLKGTKDISPGETNQFNEEALISTYDAKIQTMQASLITLKFAESQEIKDKWDKIYSVTAFYVGLSDDLGPYEYLEAMNFILKEGFDLNDLTEKNIEKLKVKLAEYRPPKIFGGTGDCGINPPFTLKQANQCLKKTKGFRLMGQKFIPDSYIFSNLVGVYTDVYSGDKHCSQVFTCVISGAGRSIRGFPRGLDVMAMLGSKRAQELLNELGDSNYKKYDEAYKKLETEFLKFNENDWNKNLYWAWLHALKPLLTAFDAGYPTFMQTKAWQDKELTTALASWSELRHDTILYAKQSYTMLERGILPPPEKPVVGYVEPVPMFYNKLLALTKMSTKGLEKMNILNNSAKHRLESLEKILERLVEISKKELENEKLAQGDYEFIENFGEILNETIAEVEDKAKKTTIISDVHTDSNTKSVLEEGIGYVKLIVVAYKLPDDRIIIGTGPVMSYYEFKQPMKDRLTDKEWRELLISNPPEEPEWTFNFIE